MKKNCTMIHNQFVHFWQGGDGIGKSFTLKLIIQRLLQSYNTDISLDLTKTKALLMTYITKVAFNFNSLKMHSTSNILVQQSLLSLPSYHWTH
jgi:hypothetical protein